MRRSSGFLVAVLAIGLLLGGCGSESNRNQSREPAKSPPGSGSADTTKPSAKPDTLPLIAIMLNLEKEMQSISSGLWRHEFNQIEQSAKRIADHAKIPRSQLKTIRSILGKKRFKAFVRDDKTVHNMAVKLSEAAANEDFGQTADLYQKLEQGCISCHRKHRTDIRESPEW